MFLCNEWCLLQIEYCHIFLFLCFIQVKDEEMKLFDWFDFVATKSSYNFLYEKIIPEWFSWSFYNKQRFVEYFVHNIHTPFN